MLLTEKSPPQKSASLCSTIGRELSLIYLIHSNNVLSLENPVGYLKTQYPALDDVAVDFANSSTFLLFSVYNLRLANIRVANFPVHTFPNFIVHKMHDTIIHAFPTPLPKFGLKVLIYH